MRFLEDEASTGTRPRAGVLGLSTAAAPANRRHAGTREGRHRAGGRRVWRRRGHGGDNYPRPPGATSVVRAPRSRVRAGIALTVATRRLGSGSHVERFLRKTHRRSNTVERRSVREGDLVGSGMTADAQGAPASRTCLLIYAPAGRGTPAHGRGAGRAGVSCRMCQSLAELREAFEDDGAGAILLFEEAIADPQFDDLAEDARASAAVVRHRRPALRRQRGTRGADATSSGRSMRSGT